MSRRSNLIGIVAPETLISIYCSILKVGVRNDILNSTITHHHHLWSHKRLEVVLLLLSMPEEVMSIQLHISRLQLFNKCIYSSEIQGSIWCHHSIVLHGIACSEQLVVGIGKVAFTFLVGNVHRDSHTDTQKGIGHVLLGIVLNIVVVSEGFLDGKGDFRRCYTSMTIWCTPLHYLVVASGEQHR